MFQTSGLCKVAPRETPVIASLINLMTVDASLTGETRSPRKVKVFLNFKQINAIPSGTTFFCRVLLCGIENPLQIKYTFHTIPTPLPFWQGGAGF